MIELVYQTERLTFQIKVDATPLLTIVQILDLAVQLLNDVLQ